MFKIIGFITTLLFSTHLQAGFEVEITPQQMQQMAEQQFPIEKQTLFAKLRLSDPELAITSQQRLSLKSQVSAYFPNQTMSEGVAQLEGELHYVAERGEFELRQLRLQQLAIKGAGEELNQLLHDLAAQLIAQSLPKVVVYRLDDKRFRDRMTKRSLQSITVRDGVLIAEVDW